MYAAGFTTAFGVHAVAANLGVYTGTRHGSLLTLGILLALYDGAEVLLKPVFGALADRAGGKPVLIGGLLAFAAASGGFLLAGNAAALVAAQLGQGAAAAAFSPAASMLVACLAPEGRGRAFGSYGVWKGLGYTLGPLLGSALVALHGYGLLFAVFAALGLAVAGWAMVAVPAAPPLPRHRQTIAGLARRLSAPAFLGPTAALAGATAALSAGVGFLPSSATAPGSARSPPGRGLPDCRRRRPDPAPGRTRPRHRPPGRPHRAGRGPGRQRDGPGPGRVRSGPAAAGCW